MVHCNSESENAGQLVEEHNYMDVEIHPRYVGNNSNLCGSPMVGGGNVLIEVGNLLLQGEEQMDRCLETQNNAPNVNKNSAYLAIFVRVGLDNPSKSSDLGEGRLQIMSNQDGGHHIMHTPTCNNAMSVFALSQHRLSPRHGKREKYEGKSPLGKKATPTISPIAL